MTLSEGVLSPVGSSLSTPLGVLSIHDIGKRFGQTVALRNITLELRPGEVVALIGENGAGKSTLCNILDGVFPPDEGYLSIDGVSYEPGSPSDALKAGIGVVHQELQVVPQMSVAENIFLGRELPTKVGLISRKLLAQRATAALAGLGLHNHVDPWAPVGSLSVAMQQLIAIAKVLDRQARFLIFDEPTASFSDEEAELLFDRISEIRSRGVPILYITHRLAEIREIADRALVLRDGRLVAEHDAASTEVGVIVRDMVGRSIDQVFPSKIPVPDCPPLLEVRGLSQTKAFQDVTFDVKPGEIFGIAGLVGTGRSEILHAIAGMTKPTSGSVAVGGHALKLKSSRDAIAHGIVLSPEDRKTQGLLLDETIEENISLPILSSLTRMGLLSFRLIHESARALVQRFDVRGGGLRTKVRDLSGGNQQKVLLGRCLASQPRVLLLDEPTRGVDVGARSMIYEHLTMLARDGMAIVMVSSELEELLGLCHRIGVMRTDRKFGGVIDGSANREDIMKIVTCN